MLKTIRLLWAKLLDLGLVLVLCHLILMKYMIIDFNMLSRDVFNSHLSELSADGNVVYTLLTLMVWVVLAYILTLGVRASKSILSHMYSEWTYFWER